MASKAIPSHLRPAAASNGSNGGSAPAGAEKRHHGKTQSHVTHLHNLPPEPPNMASRRARKTLDLPVRALPAARTLQHLEYSDHLRSDV
ncbi:uncharacterized protein A1O9_07174 [Exophiala aquamarina CBS 119918]|uniref:Uncharacterized protein n=1 Tax=Exophiala aquamarina CBS 119918 TaxID=1182545 RepID=A0A072PA48_9EURO|nr:uncharacterized protein A1O9_07174 [Exophiala aquamarina CBS 119918]KEF56984.1 hypothetical protein A1O9_07174 [Exophiala aquamarina CBS 119918]